VTDPMGVVKTYTYDDGGRVTQLDINKASSGLGGPDRLTYAYDGISRVTSGKTQTESGGSYTDDIVVSQSYDGYGQLTSETQYGGHVVGFEYDVAGALSKITYPTSSPITNAQYTLDDIGRVDIAKRTLDGGSLLSVASFEYDGHREISRIFGQHDLKRTQSWTSFREPDQLKYLKNSTSALLTGFDNAWNSDGQITVRERLHDTATYDWGEVYRYDEMGRMVKMWTNTRNPQSFSSTDPTANYDDKFDWSLGKVYERESVTTTPEGGTAASAVYTSNAGYQYTNIGTAMTWDSNGQLTDWGTTDYAWTALGQMSQAAVSGETARDYEYDAFGRRVKTLVGSAETQMLYHGWHMIGAYDDNNSTWLWQEVPMSYGEGMIEHVALDTNDMDNDSNTTEYLSYAVHEDWQNTVWALSNTSAAIIERYVHDDPFGKSHTLDASDTDIGNYASEVYHYKRMHGGVVEPVSGLYDFRNRWYSPVSGGWLSRDPLGQVDSENLYQGILAQPLVLSDPHGLATTNYHRDLGGEYIGDFKVHVHHGERGEGDCANTPGCTTGSVNTEGDTPLDYDVDIYIDCRGKTPEQCQNIMDHELAHALLHYTCVDKCKSSSWFVNCFAKCGKAIVEPFLEITDGGAPKKEDWVKAHHKLGAKGSDYLKSAKELFKKIRPAGKDYRNWGFDVTLFPWFSGNPGFGGGVQPTGL